MNRFRLPKLCGGDIELGNFVFGLDRNTNTCYEAARALLREVEGLPRVSKHHAAACKCPDCSARRESASAPSSVPGGWGNWTWDSRNGDGASFGDHSSTTGVVYDPQDWGRRFLAGNGGCAYIDLNHLELCLPEVLSARDHVAAWHAMLRIARQALAAANAKLPRGQRIHVLVNSSDGRGQSYGSHLNFLITRRAWENLFHRKLHQLLYLAAYQASSIIFTGQGKVGSENGRPPVGFQLSQRADFFEALTSDLTTFRRPLVNSRHEPLCGRYGRAGSPDHAAAANMARLHVIFYDSTLSHVASFLKVGVMQIVLAMIEAECVNHDLALDDPLEAVVRWSHDPTLSARAATVRGRRLTALELQFRFLEDAKRFVEGGGCSGIVPDCREILGLWEDTLLKLKARDLPALARRLDWALKLLALRRAMERRPGLSWHSPEVKHLDQIFGSLDPSRGLYWAYERAGLLERIVPEERIAWFQENPPENTRAWTRAMLLRWATPREVDDVDWDRIRFRVGSWGYAALYRTLDLPNPLEFTRAATESIFQQGGSLGEVLDALGAAEVDWPDRAAAASQLFVKQRVLTDAEGGPNDQPNS